MLCAQTDYFKRNIVNISTATGAVVVLYFCYSFVYFHIFHIRCFKSFKPFFVSLLFCCLWWLIINRGSVWCQQTDKALRITMLRTHNIIKCNMQVLYSNIVLYEQSNDRYINYVTSHIRWLCFYLIFYSG